MVIEKDGRVDLLSIEASNHIPTAVSILDTVLDFAERSPEIVERVKNIFAKKKDENAVEPAENTAEEPAAEVDTATKA